MAAAAPTQKIYKVYIVLHGQGIRASDNSPNAGFVYTGTQQGAMADNFFQVPPNTRIFRMVPPGHVFMSHIELNKELRNFFNQPITEWMRTFLKHTELRGDQASAIMNQGIVDPDSQTYIKSRAIFNKMLQLFEYKDWITNERLETDYGTVEDRLEFGIWITEENRDWGTPVYSATNRAFLTDTGQAREVPISVIINQIRNNYGVENLFEFYVANCSPVSQDFRNKHARLKKGDNGQWYRNISEYTTLPESIDFWRNTLNMYVKRIKIFQTGKLRLEEFKKFIRTKNLRKKKKKRKREEETEPIDFPAQDTVWGMMDDEERIDNYRLMNGILKFYPLWLERATEPEKKKIRDEIKFYIQSVSTPYIYPIRGGDRHQLGISQITKYQGVRYSKKGKNKGKKKKAKRKVWAWYTLSKELIKKIRQNVKLAKNDVVKQEFCNLIDSIYGQRIGEKYAYPHRGKEVVFNCNNLGAAVPPEQMPVIGRRIVEPKCRGSHGPARGARGRCVIQGGKRRTRKKKRRRKKRTKRNKQN